MGKEEPLISILFQLAIAAATPIRGSMSEDDRTLKMECVRWATRSVLVRPASTQLIPIGKVLIPIIQSSVYRNEKVCVQWERVSR